MRVSRAGLLLVTAAVGLAGCGAGVEAGFDPLPVVVAEPITADALGRELRTPAPVEPSPTGGDAEASGPATDPATAPEDPAPTPVPEPAETASAPSAEPTTAAAAAFIRASAAELGTAEHVVVDLDGDEEPEIVLTGVVEQRAVVRVAWWTDEGYRGLVDADAGPGLVIGDLRVSDVNADGRTEVLVTVEGDGRRSLAMLAVSGRGRLAPLEAVGGCHDGSHVYGVTGARLEARGDAPPAIVATCDDSPLPVKDWSEQRWVWRDGAYRVDGVSSESQRGRDEGDRDGDDGDERDERDDDRDDDDDDDREDDDDD